MLGLIDVGLGRQEEALREGRRAGELLRAEKDAMEGIGLVANLAMIAAWVGEKDLACEQLDGIIRRPSVLNYGELKLMPFWDPLRSDPRFEKSSKKQSRRSHSSSAVSGRLCMRHELHELSRTSEGFPSV